MLGGACSERVWFPKEEKPTSTTEEEMLAGFTTGFEIGAPFFLFSSSSFPPPSMRMK
jgi:hypothetical protein